MWEPMLHLFGALQHVRPTGGVLPQRQHVSEFTGFSGGWGWGGGVSFVRVTTRVDRPSRFFVYLVTCRSRDYLGNSTFALLLFGLEDMTGSTFEACLCLSLVLLLRLAGLRCPSPN